MFPHSIGNLDINKFSIQEGSYSTYGICSTTMLVPKSLPNV